MILSIQKIAKKFKKETLLPLAFAGFIVGSPADDVLSDAGQLQDYVYGKSGNDVLVYTPSINHEKTDHYDGGTGIDTLWLRISETEYDQANLRADLIAFQIHILNHANITSPSKGGEQYHFQSFDLSIRNVENIIVERINTRKTAVALTLPKDFKQMKDTAIDSLT